MSTHPFPLGRHAQFDQRSRGYGFAAAVGTGPQLPQQASHKVYGSRLDQGNVRSCTGNALVGCRNTAPNHRRGETAYGEDTALAVYTLATTLDDVPGVYPDQDTGSSGLAACKAAMQLHLITSYRWCFGLDHLLQALAERPVAIGTNWYEGMFTPDRRAVVHIDGQVAGGHEYVIRGYSLRNQMLWAVNSWGPTWGVAGMFYIPFADMARLLAEDGDVKVPVH